ncbi:bile acid:sodium symporter family protein [Rubrimonas cliftonensis]|uniref:Bile acid:Na+ symporter, BASS family n=1 Tax=Rubrimonas cliftonensis TaxID=89524 RepID=A0A1H4FUA3_9RHOB|nr:bile acid:sodium symporter [Rubrimonas cliftonensis]SEB00410.1 bile acid:Na+ symporter, BASS family [Rubrimonas cliftonensis]
MVGPLEQILSAVIVFFVMLGMGASLTPRDFRSALKKPHGMAIGLACQFGIMPFLGFCLVALLPLADAVAVGVMIMACMPGGTTSNMFTYFARGNLALSVLMTVASTICGVVLIPLMLAFYAGVLDLTIPPENIVVALVIVMVPVALGMAIRRASAKAGALTEKLGSWLGVAFIVFLVGSWVPRNATFLIETSAATYTAAITLGLAGIVLGYGAALLFRLNSRDARTVGIETGLQNGPLAFSIIAFTFSGEVQQSYMAVPALYSVFIVIIASLATLAFRAVDTRPAEPAQAL